MIKKSLIAIRRMIQGQYSPGSFLYYRFLRKSSHRNHSFYCTFLKKVEIFSLYQNNSFQPILSDDLTYLGQMTHPDAVVRSLNGKETIFLAVTGYPYGDEQAEDPCVYVSSDGIYFKSAGENPMASSRRDLGRNHLSDVDLIDDGSEFLLYYRDCRYNENPPQSIIWRTFSKDFVHWDAPTVACRGEINEFLSPAIVKADHLYSMYYVDFSDTPGKLYRRISENGIFQSCVPQLLKVLNLPADQYLWHLDVVKYCEDLHGLFTLSADKKGSDTRLYYGYSEDGGETWNIGKEISEWRSGAFQKIYRSTLVVFEGEFQLYISVQTKKKTWFVYRLSGFDPSRFR